MSSASIAVAALALTGALWAQTALAAQESDFVKAFAGVWVTYDAPLDAGGTCEITLSQTAKGSLYEAKQAHCGGALAGVMAWGIVDQQLALMDATGKPIVRVGGNQNRVSGDLAGGGSIILERKDKAQSVHSLWAALGCVYYGYTSRCADSADSAPPSLQGGSAKVLVLVKLNARTEARPDAPVVTVLQPNACVPVKQCTTASEGLWCKVSEDGKDAWISKHSVRLSQFPIVTFVNGCSG